MSHPDPTPPLPPCLQYLSEQSGCVLGPVGAAAARLPDLEMMEEARRLAGGNITAQEWMLVHAGPGGKVYGIEVREPTDAGEDGAQIGLAAQ